MTFAIILMFSQYFLNKVSKNVFISILEKRCTAWWQHTGPLRAELTPSVDFIKLFFPYFINVHNKLERLSLAGFSKQVLRLPVRIEAHPKVECLKGAPLGYSTQTLDLAVKACQGQTL